MANPSLSEQDVRTRRITPAIARAGWDLETQLREEVTFTAGRIIVRGKMVARGKPRRADYVLYHRPNLPIAVVEAKDATHQRIGQLVWMLFLKIHDDREQELELLEERYVSPIPKDLRWRNWAADPEGMTGDELVGFVNNRLFPALKALATTASGPAKRRASARSSSTPRAAPAASSPPPSSTSALAR